MKRHAIAVVMVVLSAHLAVPVPAPAQVPTQRGNTITARLFITGSTMDYALGLTFPINPTLDAAFAYGTLPPFDSEIDLGVRLHLPVQVPGIDPYLGTGVAFTSTGGASSTGFFAQGGIAFSLSPQVTGYAGLHYVASSGTALTQYDAGLQYQFAPQLAGLLGFTGSGAGTSIYVGVSVNF